MYVSLLTFNILQCAVFAWCNQEGIRLTIYAWHAFGNMTSRPCGPSYYPAPHGVNSSSSLAQQLSTTALSLLNTVMEHGNHVAKLSGYGNGVKIDHIRYQIDREALDLEYVILTEDGEHSLPIKQEQGMEVISLRERRRLMRSIECFLTSLEGWEVQMTTREPSDHSRSYDSFVGVRLNGIPTVVVAVEERDP